MGESVQPLTHLTGSSWEWATQWSGPRGMRSGELTLFLADGEHWVAEPEQYWRAHPGGVDEGESTV